MKTLLLFSILFFISFLTFSQQWMYTDLTEAKLRLSATSLGNKAYFASGDNTDVTLNLVEIWDVTNQTWSYDYLSQARTFPEAVSCGSKVIFAGGLNFTPLASSDVVDIYDTATQEWTIAYLSEPRFLLSIVAHPASHKVLFAGGLILPADEPSAAVDIYDTETGEWTQDTLSMARIAMGAAVVGDIAIFAGGDRQPEYTNRVDIYNFITNEWTIDSLSLPRGYLAGAAVGNKALFAGGMLDFYDPNAASNNMDVYDYTTDTWSIEVFPNARAFLNDGSTIGDKVYFAGGGNFYGAGSTWVSSTNLVDIYNNATGDWSFLNLTHDLINHAVTAAETEFGSYLLVAGGASLQIDEMYSTIEVLWEPVGISESAVSGQRSAVSVYPNPTSGIVDLQFTIYSLQSVSIKIYNVQGREVAVVLDGKWSGDQVVRWDATALPAGIYYYRLTTDDRRLTTGAGKIVKY
jgi:kelch-like protein 20